MQDKNLVDLVLSNPEAFRDFEPHRGGDLARSILFERVRTQKLRSKNMFNNQVLVALRDEICTDAVFAQKVAETCRLLFEGDECYWAQQVRAQLKEPFGNEWLKDMKDIVWMEI